MKTALKTSLILSWINLIVSCLCVLGGIKAAFILGPQVALIAVVLFGAISLHSYESLRLRKGIIYNTPIDSKTPLSLQVMGFISMFFAFVSVTNGFSVLRHTKEIAPDVQKMFEQSEQFRNVKPEAILQTGSIAVIIFGLLILINVLTNMSLLKWYRNQDQEQ